MTHARTARDDPGWYTPADLPPAVAGFDDPLRGTLDVGAAGKVGLLELVLGRHEGVTPRHRMRRPAGAGG